MRIFWGLIGEVKIVTTVIETKKNDCVKIF